MRMSPCFLDYDEITIDDYFDLYEKEKAKDGVVTSDDMLKNQATCKPYLIESQSPNVE